MSSSPLVTYTNISPNKTHPRKKPIDTITIHCYVGQVTAKRGCDGFANPARMASSNYVVGYDGSIGLSVDEEDRSWCTGGADKNGNAIRVNGISGADNDQSAVTIEVACDSYHPYAVTDKAYAALIDLVADICSRNKIRRLMWEGQKSLVGWPERQNMTVHRWFAQKACPGDWLYDRMGEIAQRVNEKLEVENMNKEELKALIREVCKEVLDEMDPLYKDLENVPDYWQPAVKELLDTGAVNGGTPAEENATDVNLRRETLKAAVVAVNYLDARDKRG